MVCAVAVASIVMVTGMVATLANNFVVGAHVVVAIVVAVAVVVVVVVVVFVVAIADVVAGVVDVERGWCVYGWCVRCCR